jgi:hypothetical protein
VARPGTPAWRKAFDGVERRLAPPLASAMSSPDFQVATQAIRRAKGAVGRPLGGLVSRGLHLANLPTYGDVRFLKRQLGEVQREVLALRRELSAPERREGDPQ